VPNNSVAIENDNISSIEGGKTAGGNLYHSFSEFNIPNGNTAFFK
jgi:large exoprotein involved in heme utilization and adhesion